MLIRYESTPEESVATATSSLFTPFVLGMLGSLIINTITRRSQPTTVIVNIDAKAPQ